MIADAVMPSLQVLTVKDIEAGILLINGRQILRLDENVWIMIDGAAMLVVESCLQARHRE